MLEVLEAAGGGTLRHVAQIAEHLDKAEFDLTLAVSTSRMRHPQSELAGLRALGLRVEVVPMMRRPAPFADFVALHRLTRLMRRERYDVVHAHSSKAGFLGRWAARKAGIRRVFYTPHGFAFQCGGARGRFYAELERVAARFGAMIVAVSEGEKELARSSGAAGAGGLCVIPNAIHPPEPPTAEQRAAARAALGVPEDVPVVGTVGRLCVQKGIEHLVRAARQFDARVVVIGDGALHKRLARLAAKLGITSRVLLPGHRDDVQDLHAAMDVYVQPSLWEGLPYALLDAMGRGIPTVATDVPGNRDVVRHGETGLLAPPRCPDALADAVNRLLADAEVRRSLGRSGRELVLRRHNISDFIASIARLYRGD